MKISIIIPVYKVERYLRQCVDSILKQTYKNFEILLVDDGSPDSSGEICDEYATKDQRVHVFHKENGGVSSARNYGLDRIKGDWVMFVDADDAIAPETLEFCLNTCISGSLDIVQFAYTRELHFGEIGNISTPSLLRDEYINERKFPLCVWGALIKSTIFNDNNIRFDTSLKLAEDQIVMMQCIYRAKKIQLLSNRFYFYRMNSLGATNNEQYEDCLKSMDALSDFCDKYSAFKPNIDDCMAYFVMSLLQRKNISINEAVKLFGRYNIRYPFARTRLLKISIWLSRYSMILSSLSLKYLLFKISR